MQGRVLVDFNSPLYKVDPSGLPSCLCCFFELEHCP